ncbi:mitochondrial fission regulator 2 isoform X2 [Tachyglossus aculeatus]|uniref:mitochondrial fission regulator 2 isoform X2 n=1 Tax=Tachyglossus aculeatus TaxID=9261 RepID=UPI0018F62BAB|nr:mitochondrial fission regulator 2 isoform X2 [Tachyglossus aculeatus]
MSLMLTLLRQLLEYFGVHIEELPPIWEAHGNGRSVLRIIVTQLSTSLFSRADLQRACSVLVTYLNFPYYDECGDATRPLVPSFADIPWVERERKTPSIRFRNDAWTDEEEEAISALHPVSSAMVSLSPVPRSREQMKNDLPAAEAAIKKIAALEDELTLLRSQIAAIVAVQEPRSCTNFDQFSAPVVPPPPPPPPPPLPSLMPASNNHDSNNSTTELGKQRHAANKINSTSSEPAENLKARGIPSMMDVLKDMNKVKLRAVERSPGGRPVTNKRRRSSQWDPVSLISQALKQKFAFQDDDSFDKENRSWESSPFSSPETPKFRYTALKPNGHCLPGGSAA